MKEESEDQKILSLFADEKTKEKAFRLLIDKYQKDIYYAIRRIVYLHDDANDVTQNVFIKIWRYLDKFRGDSSLKTWITKICVNESLTFIEKKKKLLNLYDDSYTSFMLRSVEEEKYFSSDKIQQILHKAILQLPQKQQIVFTMRYYDETPYEEMSKILDTSVGALKASYHFAVKKVEEFIEKNAEL
ncbi:MAG TPA: sigma-70 family RNA polymerase sigma factor [Bacteroidales bacterium]|jgi:RNA polymerase sigma-70 factor (ECF subfamily)|nr:sigma-70 family RNA polymerase sigma factor [Bacteroidales bacterium]HOF45384.1 sigma-70 family RNA polymerase sigma factor [Bacteroidales bacterium]HOS57914.1 sigma-70 family RNA polymerase sigma factor [Bacteroidales bacterium]HRT13803.1 sigma-70 family RNA polymerase sigma factor [Bacteroidales bacterium]HXK73571.1 sigma-70 family RNA polymerase sigma factor [Bacteroidales bacterium]